MASAGHKLQLGSDNLLEVRNLRDVTTGNLETGATVTARVLDSTGTPVVGVPDPITFTEVAGANGQYRGTVPDAAVYAVGDPIRIEITATSTGGVVRLFILDAKVIEDD